MRFQDFVQWGFEGLIVSIGAYAAWEIGRMRDSIDKVKDSIGILNTNVAVVIERVDGHEHRIAKLEDKK